ncbi:MAG: hypothetical protein KC615_15920, partial [Anaerolineae bacterium]|nr:hypothetical protein [Anaerolineae bacterium]
MSVLCDKVGQMPPSFVNLLWMHAESDFAEADLAEATLTLRQLAERKDEAFFVQRKFKSATDFLKQYQQLSAMVIEQPDARTLWLNPLARHKVVPALVSAIGRIAKL